MIKRPPTKQPKADLGTFLLARNSKLFRPGAEFMLMNAKVSKTAKPAVRRAKR